MKFIDSARTYCTILADKMQQPYLDSVNAKTEELFYQNMRAMEESTRNLPPGVREKLGTNLTSRPGFYAQVAQVQISQEFHPLEKSLLVAGACFRAIGK